MTDPKRSAILMAEQTGSYLRHALESNGWTQKLLQDFPHIRRCWPARLGGAMTVLLLLYLIFMHSQHQFDRDAWRHERAKLMETLVQRPAIEALFKRVERLERPWWRRIGARH